MPRVSADLIFGLPDQSPEEARREALELADLGIAHLSAYQLTIEPGTRFGELARRGRLPLADDGDVADAFLAIDEALGARGFRHYEISNYAKAGRRGAAQPRLLARRRVPRPRAAARTASLASTSTTRARLRRRRGSLRVIRAGRAMAQRESFPSATSPERRAARQSEPLDGETLLRERIMLGLRMDEGIDLDASARDLGVPAWTAERRRASDGSRARGRIARERLAPPNPAIGLALDRRHGGSPF